MATEPILTHKFSCRPGNVDPNVVGKSMVVGGVLGAAGGAITTGLSLPPGGAGALVPAGIRGGGGAALSGGANWGGPLSGLGAGATMTACAAEGTTNTYDHCEDEYDKCLKTVMSTVMSTWGGRQRNRCHKCRKACESTGTWSTWMHRLNCGYWNTEDLY